MDDLGSTPIFGNLHMQDSRKKNMDDGDGR